MLHELFEPSTKIKMFDVYVNDVKLDYKVVNDFVIETEVEFNYFNMISRGFMRCAEELFTLSIKKHPSALTDDDSVKIIFQDNSGKIFERRYTILNCVKANCDYYTAENKCILLSKCGKKSADHAQNVFPSQFLFPSRFLC